MRIWRRTGTGNGGRDRAAGLEDERGCVLTAEARLAVQDGDSSTCAAPCPDGRHRVARVVAAHDRQVGVKQPADFGSNRSEHLFWRRSPGDQRRDAAQRRLLLAEAPQVHPRLRAEDRRRDQFGEAGQPRLDVFREPQVTGQRHHHGAPESCVDVDGHARRRTQPPVMCGDLTDLA
jgi:hypothetical protein